MGRRTLWLTLAAAASGAGCASGGHDTASGYDPLPAPPPPATAGDPGEGRGAIQSRGGQPGKPGRTPASPQADANDPPKADGQEHAGADGSEGVPAWYGDYLIDGVRHRGFSATAGDVRSARAAALAAGYEAVPSGRVVAYEAAALPDGRWRFFVLVAAEGGF